MATGRPRRLIEAIPNLSEGRRSQAIERLAETLSGTDGLFLLDVSSDPDHHRSVLTAVGEAEPLERGCLELYRMAIEEIDLGQHRGEHPRIGAVDVLPFVALEGATRDDCVALARRVGERVGEELQIPVFLYGFAASRPERVNLAQVRRHAGDELGTYDWIPDFGPAVPHPRAGATAIGAREALIAFNVVLATDRLEPARQIARRVRESSGGLPAVRALGMTLHRRRLVQVSMNLTDYRTTSIVDAYAAVAAGAHELGVEIRESEIVGLVPAAAFAGVDPEQIKLVVQRRGPVLEERIAEVFGG